jgi:hypothetical protein
MIIISKTNFNWWIFFDFKIKRIKSTIKFFRVKSTIQSNCDHTFSGLALFSFSFFFKRFAALCLTYVFGVLSYSVEDLGPVEVATQNIFRVATEYK